jgi:hypothetical protein
MIPKVVTTELEEFISLMALNINFLFIANVIV